MPPVNALIDSGPLIALFDSDDKYHTVAKFSIAQFKGKIVTTWPVLTEVSHLLSFSAQIQLNFMNWIELGALHIAAIDQYDISYITDRMKKYADRPMDLADATLMCIAEKIRCKHIFSVDSDFTIYKTKKGERLKNLFIFN